MTFENKIEECIEEWFVEQFGDVLREHNFVRGNYPTFTITIVSRLEQYLRSNRYGYNLTKNECNEDCDSVNPCPNVFHNGYAITICSCARNDSSCVLCP